MSFWDLSDGNTAVDTPKEYEIPGGNMEPIPNNSDVLAIIDQAKWAERDGKNYIELRWSVMAPDEVKNRKIFHKLWVTDLDPNAKDEAKGKAKRDKARRMLASIDANSGGNLTRTGDAPTDETMTMHLCTTPMVVKVMRWDMTGSDGQPMAGNWVSAVSPSDKPLHISDEKPPTTAAKPVRTNDLDGDSIPF
jgi:hypothetical protein